MTDPLREKTERLLMSANEAKGLCARSGLIGPWQTGKVWCEPSNGGCGAWMWVQQIGGCLAKIPAHRKVNVAD